MFLDGATSHFPAITPEFESQKKVAADPSQPLDERIEAFEDIMESEVGDTTMSRARNIEREVGFRQIYLKFEGGNPTGTQKDRIAFAQAMDAMRRHFYRKKDMNHFPEGNAIVYCEGAFGTPNGKTAHGLVRRTNRYRILSVIDSRYTGSDAGVILDGISKHIPIYDHVQIAFDQVKKKSMPATHFVIGLAPDGGRLSPEAREDVKKAIRLGLNIDSGLHDFLSEDNEITPLAKKYDIQIRDVRKTPSRNELHFFNGKIDQVDSLKIAVLGTDSAVGKRTTAWIIVDALKSAGLSAEMIGTGQTAWMQGARYCLILDSIINDFVSGEIEHAVWSAWNDLHPDAIVIEGQGSLMNPAYPGGFEILAAGRPDVVVLQHAPVRKDYDGFPSYPIHPIEKQIQAIELISGKPVIAVTINHENLESDNIPNVCENIQSRTGLPTFDVLLNGADGLVSIVKSYLS